MQFLNLKSKTNGQAALIVVLFMLAISISAVFGAAALALRGASIAQGTERSRLAYYAAEAGVEDAIYRLRSNKNVSPFFTISLNGAKSDTTVTTPSANIRHINSIGDSSNSIRVLFSEIEIGSVTINFFYGIQVSDGGLDMGNNAQVNGNVYSNGNITGNNGAKITGDVIVAGGIFPNPEVEWVTNDSNFFFATSGSNRDVAQSFIATSSGTLSKLSLNLGKVGSPMSNLIVRLAADNGGVPDKSSIATSGISPVSVGTNPSWIDVSFGTLPVLTNGVKYWIVLDYSSDSPINHWNWRLDSSDSYAGNTGKYTTSCCTGNPVWVNAGGDFAFKVWIGGITTGVDNLIIGNSSSGSGRANYFNNTTIHGSNCPNIYCLVENPPREELPISDGVIQDWKDSATLGGTCIQPECDASGNYILGIDESGILGPKIISGNLELDNGAILTMTGTVWVQGNIILSNGCVVQLDPIYGNQSGVLLTDSNINISNGCSFFGSGNPDSHIMALSARNAPTQDVITVGNTALGVIYYATNGFIRLANNSFAKEATGYGIRMNNEAEVTYDSGLSNVNFTAGPSGGWSINLWQEVK